MKKKVFCLLLVLLLFFSACRNAEAEQTPSLYFYYPRQTVSYDGGTVLLSHGTTIDPAATEVKQLVTRYLSMPLPEGALPVLPESWYLSNTHIEGDSVHLILGGKPVSDVRSSLTCVCLTKTLLQLPSVRSVSVLLPGSEEAITLTANDILLADSGMLPQEEQVVLYFPDAQRRYLVAQSISISEEDSQNKPAFILSRLLEQSDISCIPTGTKLLSVTVENGICTVDLSSEFARNNFTDFASERMAVYSIVNSLTELPEISTVDLWVAGAPLERLHYLDLSIGLARDTRLLSTALGEDRLDIELYPTVGDTGLLAPIPYVLELGDGESVVDVLLDALLSYEGANGITNCIPGGTKLLSFRMEGSTCVLDFTGEFLAGCQNSREETLAVRSVIATVCQLPDVVSVEILVEGIEPAYRESSLDWLRMPANAWFVN